MSQRMMPAVKVGSLPKQNVFKKDDILYKVVSDKIFQFLVTDDTGECRLVLRVYEDSGVLSSRSVTISGAELNFYQLNRLATNLRREFFKLANNHESRATG